MPLSIKAIDHLVIRVADLDAGEKLFTRLGFSLTPRGFHAGRGSANHTAPLSSGNYFVNAGLPPIAPEAIGFFVCQHLTRDLVWRPEWERHANGAERVAGAIVVHARPADLQATYAQLFGEAAVSNDADGLIVALGGDRISFLTPAAFNRRFPTIAIPAAIPTGWYAGATLRVRSLEKAAGVLSEAGVEAVRTPSGSLVVAPSAAAGALLEFAAA